MPVRSTSGQTSGHPRLAILLLLVLIAVAGGTERWLTTAGLVADAAALLLISQEVQNSLMKPMREAPHALVLIARAVAISGTAIALGAFLYLHGHDSVNIGRAGVAGIVISVLGLLYYLHAAAIGHVLALDRSRHSPSTRRPTAAALPMPKAPPRTGAVTPQIALLASLLLIGGITLQALGSRFGH